MSTSDLISRLRRRIRDDRPHHKALSLSISDTSADRAIAELTDGHLIVTVQGGSAPSIDFNLTRVEYSTIGRLAYELSRIDGYQVELDNDASTDHLSVSLYDVPPTDIGLDNSSIDLRHYLFSDDELDEVIEDAVQRHNPSLTSLSLPSSEEIFVLYLAHADVCRRQAYDSSKRKGLSETVDDLLAIAKDLERTYNNDTKRNARAIASPKESNSNTMDEGDVVEGHLFRNSLRTGYKSPIGQNHSPAQAVLLEPDGARDVEDTNIRLRWERNPDDDFYAAELWIDTRPDVQRGNVPGVAVGVLPYSTTLADQGSPYPGFSRPTTSKLVHRLYGANTSHQSYSLHSFIEQVGQEVTSFVVGGLEPATVYYARLFIFDLNEESSASQVVRYKTLPLRTKFASASPVIPTSAAAGTTITLAFDSDYGAITAGHKITIGGVEVAHTVTASHAATVVMPSFFNKDFARDVVVESPSGLVDIIDSEITAV